MQTKIHTTNFGEAEYPHLSKPDTKFNPDGVYKVKLKVSKQDAEKDIKIINDVIALEKAEEYKRNPKNGKPIMKTAPLPYEYDDEGNVVLTFKMRAKGINSKTKQPFEQKPKIVDHNMDDLPEDKIIWGGSILRVNYQPVGYNVASTGIGCTLRLKGVQVKKLIEGTSMATQGFSKVEADEFESRLPK